MHRLTNWSMLILLIFCASSAARAQNVGSEANTVCNFNPDQQLAVDYHRISPDSISPPGESPRQQGSLWQSLGAG
jgi:hypothetical protein